MTVRQKQQQNNLLQRCVSRIFKWRWDVKKLSYYTVCSGHVTQRVGFLSLWERRRIFIISEESGMLVKKVQQLLRWFLKIGW